jgi:vancomycin resistance protein YoaR
MMSTRALTLFAVAAMLLCVASVAAASWAGREYVLGAFTTDHGGRSEAQRHNIELAMAALDGTVLRPGATLSFNGTVGERLLEKGYERAPVMSMMDTNDEPGGGICQMASTLYDAALAAGLQIVERSPHYGPVLSVGPGRDATVQWNVWDLRFRNPYDFAVRLHTYERGDRLIAEVHGSQRLPHPVSVWVERSGNTVTTWRRLGQKQELIAEDHYLH